MFGPFLVNWGHKKTFFESEKEFVEWSISIGQSLDIQDAHCLLNQLENLGQLITIDPRD